MGTTGFGACIVVTLLALTGCASNKAGPVADAVNGSVVGAGVRNAAPSPSPSPASTSTSLVRCTSKVGAIAILENPRGYSYLVDHGSLPKSPLPLLKSMLQQTGCFTVEDRDTGVRAARSGLALRREGMTNNEDSAVRAKAATGHYTLIPHVILAGDNSGGLRGAVATFLPRGPAPAAAAGSVQFNEAQVVLMLTDDDTSEQIAAAEGNAKVGDFGIGAGVIGHLGAAAVADWGNSNEGKVVAAAMMDGINKLVPQVHSAGRTGAMPAKGR